MKKELIIPDKKLPPGHLGTQNTYIIEFSNILYIYIYTIVAGTKQNMEKRDGSKRTTCTQISWRVFQHRHATSTASSAASSTRRT